MIKMAVALLFFLIAGWWNNIVHISRTNELKIQAETAFRARQYQQAANAWAQVLNESKGPNPEVRLNLAHAYYLQNQTLKAAREYQQVVRTAPANLRSVAQQQLGNQLAHSGDYDAALQQYKAALKSNPKNQQARYNYELLLKQLPDRQQNQEETNPEQEKDQEQANEQQQNQQQNSPGNDPNKPQQKSGAGKDNDKTGLGQSDNGDKRETNRGSNQGNDLGENNSDNNDVDRPESGTGQGGNMPGEATTSQKLQQIQMPEERARTLLNAMRDAERQYLQQMPRRQRARPQQGKPDW